MAASSDRGVAYRRQPGWVEPLAVVATVARRVAELEGWPEAVVDQLAELGRLEGPAATEGAPLGFSLPPPDLVGPELLGEVYEAVLDPGPRRRRGAYYTPGSVAAGLVGAALDSGFIGRRPQVGDPAVGGGALLLAACRQLAADGADPTELVTEAVWGADVDPAAVAVARLSLGWWAWRASGRRHWPAGAGQRLVVADALVDAHAWPSASGRRPCLVVGNPPFLGQLARSTARSPVEAGRLRARHGPAAGGYVDAAVLFLLAACRHCRPGDRVLLIQPESTLVAAGAAAARREILRRARLRGLWLDGGDAFAAGVRVCAPLLEVGRPHTAWGGEVLTWRGARVEPAGPVAVPPAELAAAPTWGVVAAPLRGVPGARSRGAFAGRLGDLASATAGFRDEYYGLVPLVVERPVRGVGKAPDPGADPAEDCGRWAKLVTSGLVGPAVCHWSRRPARFAGRAWQAPVVELHALREAAMQHAVGDEAAGLAGTAGLLGEVGRPSSNAAAGLAGAVGAEPVQHRTAADRARRARLARWVTARLRPKLVLATQSAVLAAAADPTGCFVPSVPAVSVEPHDPEHLWRLLAVVCSPLASAWAAERFGGAGLGPTSLKLAAGQVLDLPLPADADAWDRAAAAYRRAASQDDEAGWHEALLAGARAMGEAYRLPAGDAEHLLTWWEGRLPSWTRRSAAPPAPPAS